MIDQFFQFKNSHQRFSVFSLSEVISLSSKVFSSLADSDLDWQKLRPVDSVNELFI